MKYWKQFRILQNISNKSTLSIRLIDELDSVELSEEIKTLISRKYKREDDNVFVKEHVDINTLETVVICHVERLEEHPLKYFGLKTAFINQKGN